MQKQKNEILTWIDNAGPEMIGLEKILTAVPALAPESGGDGEAEKAEALLRWLESKGNFEVQTLYAPDPRVASGKRPNVIVTIPGQDRSKALWIMSHLDIVPAGDLGKWETDPFTVVERDGRLFGRGTEDNQQGIVSSIFAALALKEFGAVPAYDVKLLFVADEEVGSQMGIQYLLREHDLFGKEDMFLVPDGGNADGSMVEVAEKSILWLEFTVTGRQTHASRPDTGKNAFLAGSELVVLLSSLEKKYPETNSIFTPPYSTFSPTMKRANVPNINTIPGEDVFCLDCRILPSISVDVILEDIRGMCSQIEKKNGVTAVFEIVQRVESKATPIDAPIVGLMEKAVNSVYHVEAQPVGIGGGTVAAYLRNAGYDTVVWTRHDETAHFPNEYAKIDNLIGDAKVMALLMLGGENGS